MNAENIGSIGAIGRPIYDSHNNRVKGFCTSFITSQEMVYPFIEEARRVRDTNHATRITLRFITNVPLEIKRQRFELSYGTVRDSSLWVPPQAELYLNGFETEPIPLVGEYRGYWVQYFGENNRERTEPEVIRLQEDSIINESIRAARHRNPFLKASQNGYRVELGIRNDRDIIQLYELYNSVYRDYTFPLTEDNVAGLVETPNSITALARNNNGDVVSVAIAEVAEIPTDRGLLKISELSDEATHPNHRVNGLNQACVAALTQQLLANYGDDIHLIFEEDRAVSRGVNQQSANLGFKYAGRLNRHCRMDADSDIVVEGPYEDLNVWYLPR